jgi:hypothetical protein
MSHQLLRKAEQVLEATGKPNADNLLAEFCAIARQELYGFIITLVFCCPRRLVLLGLSPAL